jgi:hypothetical protein
LGVKNQQLSTYEKKVIDIVNCCAEVKALPPGQTLHNQNRPHKPEVPIGTKTHSCLAV